MFHLVLFGVVLSLVYRMSNILNITGHFEKHGWRAKSLWKQSMGACKSYLDPKNITTVVIRLEYQNS